MAKVRGTQAFPTPSLPAPRTGPWAQLVPKEGLEDNLQGDLWRGHPGALAGGPEWWGKGHFHCLAQ